MQLFHYDDDDIPLLINTLREKDIKNIYLNISGKWVICILCKCSCKCKEKNNKTVDRKIVSCTRWTIIGNSDKKENWKNSDNGGGSL